MSTFVAASDEDASGPLPGRSGTATLSPAFAPPAAEGWTFRGPVRTVGGCRLAAAAPRVARRTRRGVTRRTVAEAAGGGAGGGATGGGSGAGAGGGGDGGGGDG